MAQQQQHDEQDLAKDVDALDDQDVKLGPGWMHKERRTTKKQRPKSEFEYSKEELLSFRVSNSVIPFESVSIPHIASEEALMPVNLSPHQLKEFEQLQQRFKNNISPALGRGRGRGRGRGGAPVGGGRGRGEARRESLGGRKSDASEALKPYRTPRERGGERGAAGAERGGFRRYSMDQSWGKRDMFGFETERRGGGRGKRDPADEEDDEYGLYNDDFESERADEGKELRTPPGLENLKRWYYEDPQKVVRGPFTDREMEDWFLAGYFPKTLPIRKEDETEFVPLGTFEGNPFVPTRPKASSSRPVVGDKERKPTNKDGNWARASREKRTESEEGSEEAVSDKQVVTKEVASTKTKEVVPIEAAKKAASTPADPKPVEKKQPTPSKQSAPQETASVRAPPQEPEKVAEDSFELEEGTQEQSWDTLMDSYDDLSADALGPLADVLDAKYKSDEAEDEPESQEPISQEPLRGHDKPFGGRKAWDVHELERQFESLEQDDETDIAPHPQQPLHPYGNQNMAPAPHMHQQPPHPHHPQHPHPQMQPHFYQQPYMPPQMYMQQPRPMEKLERIQGVYDMASLEEQLLRQSATSSQPSAGMPLHGQPQPAPWVAPENASGNQVRSLRQIQEMELQERQRQAYERAQHEQRQAQLRSETGDASRSPKPTPFQAVWGHDFAGLSLQDIQAKIQQEHDEEAKNNAFASPQEQSATETLSPSDGSISTKTSAKQTHSTPATQQKPAEDIDIWAVPEEQSVNLKQPQQPKSADNRRGGPVAKETPKNAWGTGNKESTRKLTLKEIQEHEQADLLQRQQREALDREHTHRQQAALRNPPPVWGLSPDSSSSGASLQNIQQEQAHRETKSDATKTRTHVQPEPEFLWGSLGSDDKPMQDSQAGSKPRLDKIQQEQRTAHPKKESTSRATTARTGWGSPWTAEPVAAQPLSIREIQEQEAIKRRNEEARKKQQSAEQQQTAQTQEGGIARLLWHTDNAGDAPPSLSEIIQQERKQRPKVVTPSGPAASPAPGGWQVPSTSDKLSLKEIQQQEVKQKSGGPKTPQKKVDTTSPQAQHNKSPEPHGKKVQPAQPQSSKRKAKPQPITAMGRGSVWGALPTAPKTSLADIQAHEAAASPAPTKQPFAAVVSDPKPPSVTTPTKQPAGRGAAQSADLFWDLPSEPSPSAKRVAAAPAQPAAVVNNNDFPSLGDHASSRAKQTSAPKKKPQQQKQPAPARQQSPVIPTDNNPWGALQQPQPQPKAKKGPSPAASVSGAKKPRMKKLDPTMLGFSSGAREHSDDV